MISFFVKRSVSMGMALFSILVSFPANTMQASNNDVASTSDNPHLYNVVILQYHHVSTETPAITSISPDMYEQHMAYLSKNHHVIDLQTALDAMNNKQPLPDKSVVITFDDGYVNILENAHPIMQKYNFPYTIFINPETIGQSNSQLSWEQIDKMQSLVTFANHTMDHIHLLDKRKFDTSTDWLKSVMANINQAEDILTQKLGYSKKWLAYPFGEYNNALKQALLDDGYISFGQQSGAMSIHSDFAAIPRFPAAGIYANLDSLKTKLNSLAMPVTQVQPDDTEFAHGTNFTGIGLEVDGSDLQLSNFACYFKGEKLKIEIDGEKIKVPLNLKLKAGRARINCTVPSKSLKGRFYWYSFPMFTPTESGKFLD